MNLAFLDESGDPGDPISSATRSRYFLVAALLTAQARPIVLHVRRARRAAATQLPGGEFKARHVQARVIHRFLATLAAEAMSLIVIVADKQRVRQPTGEALYQAVVSRAVQACAMLSPRLHVTLDKRYTHRRQQAALETAIRQELVAVPQNVVVIETRPSEAVPELQAVDCVAWAFWQKYERNDDTYAQRLAGKVVREELLK